MINGIIEKRINMLLDELTRIAERGAQRHLDKLHETSPIALAKADELPPEDATTLTRIVIEIALLKGLVELDDE